MTKVTINWNNAIAVCPITVVHQLAVLNHLSSHPFWVYSPELGRDSRAPLTISLSFYKGRRGNPEK